MSKAEYTRANTVLVDAIVWEPRKSVIKMGDFHILLTKRFNWFNRMAMKIVFGWDVKNIEEGGKDG